jgi:hypothetical protein
MIVYQNISILFNNWSTNKGERGHISIKDKTASVAKRIKSLNKKFLHIRYISNSKANLIQQ